MTNELEALIQRGIILFESGKVQDAENLLKKLLEIYPQECDVFNILGTIYARQRRFTEARPLFEKAVNLQSDNPIFNSNYGNLLQDMGEIEESLPFYFKALEIKSDFDDALYNLGNALRKLERYNEALTFLQKVKNINKNYIKAYIACAFIYEKLKNLDLSARELEEAEKIDPNSYDLLSNLAVINTFKKNYPLAVSYFKRAFETGKADATFFANYATACVEMQNPQEAIRAYLKSAEFDPANHECLGRGLHQKMMIADWSDINHLNSEIIKRIQLGQNVVDPFGYMGFSDSEVDLKHAAITYLKDKFRSHGIKTKLAKYPRHKKIRIAYVSGEFKEHANGSLMTGLIESHNKEKFEIIGLDNGNGDDSSLRRRLLASFDEFIDIKNIGDFDLTHQIRAKKIDILFNLNGFFGEHRTGIFANRAAPIQINFLGCPGTMGVDYMDYLVADPVVIPESSYQYYTEKIILMPHSYQINDSKRPELKRNLTRKDCGLPEGKFIFNCFNNIYKITPPTFQRWMRILNRVPGSVLWFYNNFPEAEANLRREAQALGVDPSRLFFSPYIKMYDHLERYALADLFLDSLPYNAHTSASDALWANLPVLTLQGKSFAGRVAASLLHAIKMPELITYTDQDFEDRAVDLATHPEKLAALKVKLAKNRLATPLFDTQLYTKHFESALIEAYERYQSDLAPAHIVVKP